MLVSLSTIIRCVLINSTRIRASRLDWKRRDPHDGYQFLILRRFDYSSVSSANLLIEHALNERWFLMDRAGRRPILLTGAAAMALFLTLTGYWIYIDQAYTPNAGTSSAVCSRCCMLTSSRNLRHHLQRCIWNVMGSSPLVVSSRDHAPPIPGQGSFAVDRYQLAFRAFLIPRPLKDDIG
jgi:hypothetical protein